MPVSAAADGWHIAPRMLKNPQELFLLGIKIALSDWIMLLHTINDGIRPLSERTAWKETDKKGNDYYINIP